MTWFCLFHKTFACDVWKDSELYQNKNENIIYEVCGRVNFWLCDDDDDDDDDDNNNNNNNNNNTYYIYYKQTHAEIYG